VTGLERDARAGDDRLTTMTAGTHEDAPEGRSLVLIKHALDFLQVLGPGQGQHEKNTGLLGR